MKINQSFGFSGAKEHTRVIAGDEETRFIALKASDDAAYWCEWRLEAPIADSFIMIPACCYDGNRFQTVSRQYPPMYNEDEFGLDAPVRMTGVPALKPEGDSFMDVTTGDMTLPCVCVLRKSEKKALMLFFEQSQHGLNHGVTLEQTGDMLTIRLRAPAKRRLVYRWYDGYPSLRENPEADLPLSVKEGDETVIAHRLFVFDCEDIPALYRAFFEKRSLLYTASAHANLPFSHFWHIAEEQHNLEHFNEDEGFYGNKPLSETKRSGFGWCGGGMMTLTFMREGSSLSCDRAVRTLQFIARLQSQIGWYHSTVDNGKRCYNDFGRYGEKYYIVLTRIHADVVYYMFRQIEALRLMGREVPEDIMTSAVMGARALKALWERYGQIGQLVNGETGELLVGGSTSGAIVPAALCMAARVTGDDSYLDTARAIGAYFDREALKKGLTTGGPGEILSAPDSESCAALVESYVVLWEADGGERWLQCAREAAHMLSSWVVGYDYAFPPESRFGKMDIRSAGSVWANVQNKHSAPGMCTAGGGVLLKLYRATGDELYLELMARIAHFMPQVVSYPERPMYTTWGEPLKPGKMCERVNLSDWEGTNNVGDSIGGDSVWPAAALMLTYLETPGVYANPDTGLVCVSDHVNAWWDNGTLWIENPTSFPATVKVMIETETERAQPLGGDWQDRMIRVDVAPGQRVSVPT